jgi:hypothetical protein
MIDPMTFSDDRLRTLVRRMDRGEITREEAARVMSEHQVDVRRFRRIGDEVDAEGRSAIYEDRRYELYAPIAALAIAGGAWLAVVILRVYHWF